MDPVIWGYYGFCKFEFSATGSLTIGSTITGYTTEGLTPIFDSSFVDKFIIYYGLTTIGYTPCEDWIPISLLFVIVGIVAY